MSTGFPRPQETQPVIPDYLPQVSVDIGMGDLADSVEFNFETFQDYLVSKGVAEDEVSSFAPIVIMPHSRHKHGGGTLGEYDTAERSIELYYRKDIPRNARGHQRINEVLIHETEHALDGMSGLKFPRTKSKIQKLGLVVSALTAGSIEGWLGTRYGIPLQQRGRENAALAGMTAGVAINSILLGCFHNSYYYLQPHERRAYRAQYAARESSKLMSIIVIKEKLPKD